MTKRGKKPINSWNTAHICILLSLGVYACVRVCANAMIWYNTLGAGVAAHSGGLAGFGSEY